MNSPLSIIIGREYFSRVKRKSFIISTILMPVFMIAMMAAPAAIAIFTGPEDKTVAVIDETGIIAPTLQNDGDVKFVSRPDLTLGEAKENEDYDAVLVIGADVVSDPTSVTLYSRGAPSIQTETFISGQLENTIQDIRLKAYDIENLAQILDEVKVDVTMTTYRIDKDEETETSSLLSYMVGLVMAFMLYMFILLYGQMVMTSIIEEKNNRVLEIVVSSVNPTSLMLGKICGIGLVAVTQILIWAAMLAACSAWLMPSLIAAGMSAGDATLMAALGQLGDTGYILSIFGYILLFLIGGYLFYSSIYAAIGSAVDNIQDASQLQTIAVVPIILAIIVSMSVINDPNSTLAFWASVIPFTSPVVMMGRIPFGIPAWEIILSVVLLYISFMGMIWLSAKIYRVGIFMYGKKPNLSELIRWARYK